MFFILTIIFWAVVLYFGLGILMHLDAFSSGWTKKEDPKPKKEDTREYKYSDLANYKD